MCREKILKFIGIRLSILGFENGVFNVDPNVFILITAMVPMYHWVGFRSERTESKI